MFTPHKKPSRLGQWNGRRRSSRSEEPLLPQLQPARRAAAAGRVLATALGATLLAFFWGTPLPYRVGEITPHDLRARVYFRRRQPGQDRPAIATRRWTSFRSEERTDERCEEVRDAEPPVVDHYRPGHRCWCSTASRSASSSLELLEAEIRSISRTVLTMPDHGSRGIALFLLFTLLAHAGRPLRRPLPAQPRPRACPRSSASAPWCC